MQLLFWYSREEVARLLSISLREVDRLIGKGTLETVRHGRRRLVLGESLCTFLTAGSGRNTKANGEGGPS
jgi:excisionase family DNA binding protein